MSVVFRVPHYSIVSDCPSLTVAARRSVFLEECLELRDFVVVVSQLLLVLPRALPWYSRMHPPRARLMSARRRAFELRMCCMH